MNQTQINENIIAHAIYNGNGVRLAIDKSMIYSSNHAIIASTDGGVSYGMAHGETWEKIKEHFQQQRNTHA